MAVLFKVLASALLVAALTQGSFGAPKDTTGTRGSTGTSVRDPLGSHSVYPAKDPKKDVELVNPVPVATSRPSYSRNSDCPGAYDGPSNYTIILLETRADQLESEVKTPRRSVIEALGEDNVRRLHAEFATAAAGFRGMLTDARRLALEQNLPCADRKTILKRYTEKNSSFTKKVADAYGVLAAKVREYIAKKGKGSDSRLQHAADEYDSLGATYLQAHGRAERQRVAAAKLTPNTPQSTDRQSSPSTGSRRTF